ncbi:hypothetical protein GWI34_17775 [Actinomadura sp. DSM 109109]|nr:hypothetical protein [Actinomadura lepetitiana]
MRVTVESTGGFSGQSSVVAQYDTAALPPGQAGRVREAVDALASAHARGDQGEVGADLPAYRITVSGDGDEAFGAEGGPRVYEVRGDPTSGAASVLRTLLSGPDTAP